MSKKNINEIESDNEKYNLINSDEKILITSKQSNAKLYFILQKVIIFTVITITTIGIILLINFVIGALVYIMYINPTLRIYILGILYLVTIIFLLAELLYLLVGPIIEGLTLDYVLKIIGKKFKIKYLENERKIDMISSWYLNISWYVNVSLFIIDIIIILSEIYCVCAVFNFKEYSTAIQMIIIHLIVIIPIFFNNIIRLVTLLLRIIVS